MTYTCKRENIVGREDNVWEKPYQYPKQVVS